MSRLLDLLRRQRPDPPAGGGDPLRGLERDARLLQGAAGRAIVLETLSGTPPRARWRRRVIVAALGVPGLAAILVYAIASGRGPHLNRLSDTPPPAVRAAAVPPAPGLSAVRPQPAAIDGGSANPAPPGGRSASHSTATRPEVQPQDERLARALKYQQSGDVGRAIAEYRAILQADDSNVQAHNNLGLLYEGLQRIDDAIGEFRRAVAIDPAYAKARNNLGVALMRAGTVEEAAGEFRRVLSDDPRNRDATINLGLSQRAAGRAEEARETLMRAIEIDSHSAVAHYNLALLCEDAHDTARALDHYESYLRYATGPDAAPAAAVREHCEALRRRLIK